MALTDRVMGVRQPEYTGENRCLPCTVINLVLGGALSAATAGVVHRMGFSPTAATVTGAGLFFMVAIVIYVRGYLVPGTPQITGRYLPPSIRETLGKPTTHDGLTVDGLDIEAILRDAGIVDAPGDGVVATETFRTAWTERAATLDDEVASEVCTRFLDADPDDLWLAEYGDAFKAMHRGRLTGAWRSDTAYREDMAAVTVFEDRLEEWADTTTWRRCLLLAGFRACQGACHACGASLSLATGSCCGGTDTVTVRCDRCELDVLELRAGP